MTGPNPGHALRIVIADDQASVRQGLVLPLDALPGIEVVGAAADGERALALVAEHHPDAILLDLHMPVLDGIGATRRLTAEHPGVAVVVLPGDVALRPAPKRGISPNAGLLPVAPVVRPAEAQLTALADLLNSGKRVTLFCGRGCAGAHDSLMKLAEILKSPIVHALGGKDHVEYDNPYDVGMTGFIGFSSGYAAMHACDVLLMLGTDFPYKQFLPDDARIAHHQCATRP